MCDARGIESGKIFNDYSTLFHSRGIKIETTMETDDMVSNSTIMNRNFWPIDV